MKKETSLFREIMGESQHIKILEYLIEWRDYDITLGDIVRGAKVQKAKTKEIISNLKKKGIVSINKRIKINYTFNINDGVSKSLIVLFEEILKKSLKKNG